MSYSKKYPRSLHACISKGTTSDDRFMPKGYIEAFAQLPSLILTEKLDGQNNCLNRQGVFARSHQAPSAHPWDRPLWERWELIKKDLGDLEIFGENMFGIHSIEYKKLESYYYVFGIRDRGRWLSWEEVEFYAAMLDFPTVPVLNPKASLQTYVNDMGAIPMALSAWLSAAIGMEWEDYCQTSGQLEGYCIHSGQTVSEGFVIRNAAAYEGNAGLLPVQSNELDSLFKIVRQGHVQTDEHWTKHWRKARLINTTKHHWYNYEYLKHK